MFFGGFFYFFRFLVVSVVGCFFGWFSGVVCVCKASTPSFLTY